jgi:hypothetical protein
MTVESDKLAAVLQEAAPPGSRLVGSRRWVGEPNGEIRTIVEFQTLKGGQYSARWGISIDFVPLLHKHRLAWKRTFASATFDLCIDPIDVEGDVPNWCSFGQGDSRRHLDDVAQRVRNASSEDFSKTMSLGDVRRAFEERSQMGFRRFSLDNYVQTDLAWGLLELATANAQMGSTRLSKFCERFGVDPACAVMTKAKAQATRLWEADRSLNVE